MPTFNYPSDFIRTMWRIIDGDIYVSYSGHDSAGGGTPMRPYATIQYAINAATSGQKIVVGTGAYNEHLNGGAKNCEFVADGTVEMEGAAIGGAAFTNTGASTVVTGFKISNYESCTNTNLLRFEQCFLNNSDILGEITTLQNCVMLSCDVLDIVTDFLNCTFIDANKPDNAGGVTVENCHFEFDCTFYFDSFTMQFFDNCNQENGSEINIDSISYSSAAAVNAAFPQYQILGRSDHALFNAPEINDYTLKPTSTLLQAGTHSQPIGAYPLAIVFNGDALVGSLVNVIRDGDGYYVLPEEIKEGYIETKVLDIGSLRTLGRVDLFSEEFFSPDFFGSVTFNQDTFIPPRPITFQMRYSADRESLLKTEYKEFIWDKMPTVDTNNRGNGDRNFNALTIRVITAQYVQLRITLRHTTETFFLLQENSDSILLENGSKLKTEQA